MPIGWIEQPTSPLRVARSTTELNGLEMDLWTSYKTPRTALCRYWSLMSAFVLPRLTLMQALLGGVSDTRKLGASRSEQH